MISLEKFSASWEWRERRGGIEAIAPNDGDLDMLGYSIIPKRTGKFFVEARHIGGGKENLPFAEYATVEEAKNFIVKYEYRRQEDFNRTTKFEW